MKAVRLANISYNNGIKDCNFHCIFFVKIKNRIGIKEPLWELGSRLQNISRLWYKSAGAYKVHVVSNYSKLCKV